MTTHIKPGFPKGVTLVSKLSSLGSKGGGGGGEESIPRTDILGAVISAGMALEVLLVDGDMLFGLGCLGKREILVWRSRD